MKWVINDKRRTNNAIRQVHGYITHYIQIVFLSAVKEHNSLTTEKQTTKFSSANFQKMLRPSYIILRIQRLEGKQCRYR